MKRPSPAAVCLGLLIAAGLAADVFFPGRATEQNLTRVLEAPSWAHPFGTDSLGRDLLARLLVGTKISLGVGLLGSFVAVAIGLVYGLISGWRGGALDRLMMRATDVLMSVPSFVLVAVFALALQSLLPFEEGLLKSFIGLTLGISLTHWMNVARVVRGLALQTRALPYIEAARALGAGDARILGRHVLPNIRSQILVLLGLQIPANILYESYMSFIGVGIQPPDTSWGLLVQEGWKSLGTSPHLILFPALVLFIAVWSLNSLLRPRLDRLDMR